MNSRQSQQNSVRRARRRPSAKDGFSLLELMFAAAIFLLVFGALAQALISFHVALQDQQQRAVAVQHCRSVLSAMRGERADKPGAFPDCIVDKWPNGSAVAGFDALRDEQVVVTYGDTNANPLSVTVTCTWDNLVGRQITFAVSSLLTDQ